MPSAMLRSCATVGCTALVAFGKCAEHATQAERWRGSAASRGYGTEWRRFRVWVRERMISLGIAPVCGAALPGGPVMTHSRCRQARRLNDKRLHLDHEPPLLADERGQVRVVCDPLRVGWLCETCHNTKTAAEQR